MENRWENNENSGRFHFGGLQNHRTVRTAMKFKDTSSPAGSADKESACNMGDLGSIPGLGRSPGDGNGNPLQYSCLGNLIDRVA